MKGVGGGQIPWKKALRNSWMALNAYFEARNGIKLDLRSEENEELGMLVTRQLTDGL